MLPPASKKVATGGPFGSNGNGAVEGSSDTPPRPPAPMPSPGAGAPPGLPAPRPPAAPGAPAPPRPRPRPGGAAVGAHPHAGEVDLAVGRARGRRVVADAALRVARHRRVLRFRPLRRERHGTPDENGGDEGDGSVHLGLRLQPGDGRGQRLPAPAGQLTIVIRRPCGRDYSQPGRDWSEGGPTASSTRWRCACPSASRAFARHLGALFARFAQPDGDGLLAALHRAARPALQRAPLAAAHRRLDRLRCLLPYFATSHLR